MEWVCRPAYDIRIWDSARCGNRDLLCLAFLRGIGGRNEHRRLVVLGDPVADVDDVRVPVALVGARRPRGEECDSSQDGDDGEC